jgi:hypothetical protein
MNKIESILDIKPSRVFNNILKTSDNTTSKNYQKTLNHIIEQARLTKDKSLKKALYERYFKNLKEYK